MAAHSEESLAGELHDGAANRGWIKIGYKKVGLDASAVLPDARVEGVRRPRGQLDANEYPRNKAALARVRGSGLFVAEDCTRNSTSRCQRAALMGQRRDAFQAAHCAKTRTRCDNGQSTDMAIVRLI